MRNDSGAPSTDGRHVVVVGGGIAGLVAARELALGGARVSLYEREHRLGGRVCSVQLGGAPIDMGAEAFATRGGSVQQLLEELGLGGDIVRPAALGSWVIDGDRAVPLPPGGALGIPSTPLSASSRDALGIAGALRAACESLMPRLRGVDAQASIAVDARTTIADLVRARLGSRVLERLVRPIALGVYSTDPERLSISAVPGLAAALEREGSLTRAARSLRAESAAAGGAVAALRGGMVRFVDALTEDLERLGAAIHLGSEITGLEEVRADAVLVTTPGLGATPEAPATETRVTAVEVVALAIDPATLARAPRGTGALVTPRTREINAKALTHVTAKWPDRLAARPRGEHIVRLSYGRAGSAPETEALDDDAAFELARRDASRVLGIEIPRAAVRAAVRRRWETVTGVHTPESARAGVSFAGDWVHGTGLASVVPGAREAARELLATLTSSTALSTASTTESALPEVSPHESTV